MRGLDVKRVTRSVDRVAQMGSKVRWEVASVQTCVPQGQSSLQNQMSLLDHFLGGCLRDREYLQTHAGGTEEPPHASKASPGCLHVGLTCGGGESVKLFQCACSLLPKRTRGYGKCASTLDSWELVFSLERLQAASWAGRAGPVLHCCHLSSKGSWAAVTKSFWRRMPTCRTPPHPTLSVPNQWLIATPRCLLSAYQGSCVSRL